MTQTESTVQRIMGPFRVRPLAIVVFVLLLFGVAANYAMTPRIRTADSRNFDLEHLVPTKFAGWTAQNIENLVLPDPATQRLVNKLYNVVLTRAYRDAAGRVVMLVIAYGGDQSDALQLHRPEVCYSANGYHVDKPYYDDVRLAGREIHLARVPTRDNYEYEPVSYWMRVGDRQVSTNMDRQLAKLLAGLRGIIPDGVLVRVSTRSQTDGTAADYALQDRFIADLLANVDPRTQELLVGKAAMAQTAQKG